MSKGVTLANVREIAAKANIAEEYCPVLRKALVRVTRKYDDAVAPIWYKSQGKPGSQSGHDYKKFRQLKALFKRTLDGWSRVDEAVRKHFDFARGYQKPYPPNVERALTSWMAVCDDHEKHYARKRGEKSARRGRDRHDLGPLYAIVPEVRVAWKSVGKKGWAPSYAKGTSKKDKLHPDDAGWFFFLVANACRDWCDVADYIPEYTMQDCLTVSYGKKKRPAKSARSDRL